MHRSSHCLVVSTALQIELHPADRVVDDRSHLTRCQHVFKLRLRGQLKHFKILFLHRPQSHVQFDVSTCIMQVPYVGKGNCGHIDHKKN